MAEEVKADSTAPENEAPQDSDVCVEPTALEKKIIRQVEYYFGDANLPKDKFLLEETKKDDGWVTLKTLLTFNRLKSLSEEAEAIITALKKSSNDLLELKDDGSAIRRYPTKPVPTDDEERKKDMQQRLLYVKGFPTELTLDELIEFFDQYGTDSIQQRWDAKKKFKGSVFVLFSTAEKAKAFLDAEEIKYKETPLIERLYKHDYIAKKQKEKMGSKQEEIKKNEERKKIREEEEKKELQAKITRRSVLKVKGLSDDTKVDAIKEFFNKFGKVAWVDFCSGDEHALVRYATENEANTAWEKAESEAEDKKVKFGEAELTAQILEGDEEEQHWKNMFQSISNKFGNKKNKFVRGRGRGGKRSYGNRDDSGAAKKAKTE